MKRFWVVLLSLGFVMAFSASAFAVSADFEGKVYIRGWYISNPTMQDQGSALSTKTPEFGPKGNGSAAFVDQRTRIYPVFKIADGLALKMRMDFLEDKWMGGASDSYSSAEVGGDVMKETLQVDHAYIQFKTAIGAFSVGYQESIVAWGTKFMNASSAGPAIQYIYKAGDATLGAAWIAKAQNTALGQPWDGAAGADMDGDLYALQAKYKTKAFDAGAQLVYLRDASARASKNYLTKGYAIEPYASAKFGPVELQAEAFYIISGDQQDPDVSSVSKVSMEGRGGWVDAKFKAGPAYVGASYIYMSGDDVATTDKSEGGINTAKAFGGASSLKPGLMMFYSDYTDQAGKYVTLTGEKWDKTMGNVKLWAVYAGYAVTPKLDLWANVMKMDFDQKLKATSVSTDIGMEFDLTATYKIYDNLELELAGAYLKAGDAWKGTSTTLSVDDNYFLRSTLNLEF